MRRALSWACWKTYVGRPEGDMARRLAMTLLGNGSGDFDPTDTDGPRLEGVPTGKFCANCGRGDASKTCGRCMAQTYCSTECQRDDWKRHKASCQTPRAAANEEGNAAAAAGPSNKPAADLELEKIRADYQREQARVRQAVEESPVFPELKAAIAEFAKFSLNAAFPDRRFPFFESVLDIPEEDMLDIIESAGLDRPAEGRANLLRRLREAVEKDLSLIHI